LLLPAAGVPIARANMGIGRRGTRTPATGGQNRSPARSRGWTSFPHRDVGATVRRSLGVDPEGEIRDPRKQPARLGPGPPMAIPFQNE
jgi:hypothetical protein